MTHWKSNNLWLEQKTGQVYIAKKVFYWKLQALHRKQLKTRTGRKRVKDSGIYNSYYGPLSQEWIDERHWFPHWHVSLTKVISNTWLLFRVVLASSRNILSGRLYWLEPQHP